MITHGFLILLCFTMDTIQDPASMEVHGTVFLDSNQNGTLDGDEAGLSGVGVSNGRDIVHTDPKGHYALTARQGDVVFVIKPGDTSWPLDAHHLPRFFRVMAGTGTPAGILRFRGLEPDEQTPDVVDFPLLRHESLETFKVVMLADTQPQSPRELDFMRDRVIAELVDVDAAFGMTLGDVMYDDLSMIPRYNRIMAQTGIPWINVPGNHDLNFLSPDETHARDTWKRHYGPPTFSFNHGPAHFVVLDDVRYLGSNQVRNSKNGEIQRRDPPDLRGKGAYEGGLTEDQLTFLRQDLSHVPKKTPIILVMHIPLLHPVGPERPNTHATNLDAILACLDNHETVVVLAGHMHTNENFLISRGPDQKPIIHHTLAAACGMWWSGPMDTDGIPLSIQSDGTPVGYYLMTVNPAEVTLQFKAAGHDPGHQMRIMLDAYMHLYSSALIRDTRPGELWSGPIPLEHVPATRVIVNLFNGGPDSCVTMTTGHHTVEMEPITGKDPAVAELVARYPDQIKSWGYVADTTHLWHAPLPTSLPPGVHTLRIHATDAYGHEVQGTRIIEIFKQSP